MRILCGFLATTTVNTALGGARFSTAGSATYFIAVPERNADGGLREGATCEADTNTDRQAALAVSVQAIGDRPDLAQVATLAHDGKADFTFPAGQGVGGAVNYQSEDRDFRNHQAGRADVLWGNWDVTVAIDIPGSARDPAKDAVAIVVQVVHQLNLPDKRTLPLPTLTPTPE